MATGRSTHAAAAGADFPEPAGLFTIKDLGGWSEVNKRFFDKEAGIVADIERQVGRVGWQLAPSPGAASGPGHGAVPRCCAAPSPCTSA